MKNERMKMNPDKNGFYRLTARIIFKKEEDNKNGLKINFWSDIPIAIHGEMDLSFSRKLAENYLKKYLSNKGRNNKIKVTLEMKTTYPSPGQKTLFVSKKKCCIK